MSDEATAPPFVRDLHLGDTGPDVVAVKRALIKAGDGDGIAVTPTLGAAAVKDIKLFQQAHHVTVTGAYNPGTHAKLSPYFDAYGISLLEKELAAMYLNPFRAVAGILFDGYDQGIDFAGSGLVYAVGPALVTVSTERAGWPGHGAVSYQLTEGKAKGKTIYFAENITPLVSVGQRVTARTAIAMMHPDFPHIESGWAQPVTDNPMSQPISHGPTHFGCNFGDFLRSLGETHCPHAVGESGTPLPAGWPTWL